MTRNREDLIANLVAELEPVAKPGRVWLDAVVWLAAATVYSVAITFALGPLRPGALKDLGGHPLFMAETVLAATAIVVTALAALRSAIPGEPRVGRLRWLLPLAAWVSVYVVGLAHPPAYVSSLGGRFECLWQVVLVSLPAFVLFVLFMRRKYPLWPRWSGFLAGAAAAAIPGALMQFGCMYVPEHILTHHIAPIFLTAGLGALLGPWVVKARGAAAHRSEGEQQLH